jgi:hypothetical protein
MTLRLVVQNSSPACASPYRLLDDQDRELTWANDFLDAQSIRQLSPRSLRAYAYDLLHFARWLQPTRRPLAKLNQACLLDYVRGQLDHEPNPTPSTINHRLGVLRCLYRFRYGREIPAGKSHFQHTYTARSPLGYGRPQPKLATGLRLRQPRRVVVPLSADEVACCWMACVPVNFSTSSSKISASPKPNSASSAKATKSVSSPCPLKPSRSSKIICA